MTKQKNYILSLFFLVGCPGIINTRYINENGIKHFKSHFIDQDQNIQQHEHLGKATCSPLV